MKLLFDIGGTHTRLALSDGPKLERIKHFATDPSAAGFEALIAQLRDYVKGQRIDQAVGGMPGQLSRASERLLHCPNLPGWIDLPVRRRIESALGVPAMVANDTALVGLGEATKGAGRKARIVVYITVSTGVNGVRVVDKQIEPSAWGFEIGSQLIAGADGAVELASLVSGAALKQEYGVDPATIDNPRVWTSVAYYLATGLYNTLLHWSPDVVVMGGPMMKDIKLDNVRAALLSLPRVFEDWPPLISAELGDEGGLYGALAYSEQKKL